MHELKHLAPETLHDLTQRLKEDYPQVKSVESVVVGHDEKDVVATVTFDNHADEDAAFWVALDVMGALGAEPQAIDWCGGVAFSDVTTSADGSPVLSCSVALIEDTTPESQLYDIQGNATDNDAFAALELVQVRTVSNEEVNALVRRSMEHERYAALYNDHVRVTVVRTGGREKNQVERLNSLIDANSVGSEWRPDKDFEVAGGYRVIWWQRADVPGHRLLLAQNPTNVI